MKKLAALVGLVMLSIAWFVGVFSFVHRPLVVGEIQKQLDYKLAYAKRLASPKIIVLAGSNGRYSHRCDEFTQATGMPCVNASIGVGIGLDFLFDQWWPVLHAGDVVYMPLEYSQYGFTNAQMHDGLQNALLVHDRPEYLHSLGSRRMVDAYGSFDLSFLLQGLVEMGLDRRGYKRRSSLDSLTPQGDESGHSAQVGVNYASFLRTSRFEPVALPAASDARSVIEAFLERARREGVRVVGGLPTVPDNVDVPSRSVNAIKALYERQGHRFIVLPGRSRYPMSCFFDTLYHLNEECQIVHSRAVGEAVQLELTSALDAR